MWNSILTQLFLLCVISQASDLVSKILKVGDSWLHKN